MNNFTKLGMALLLNIPLFSSAEAQDCSKEDAIACVTQALQKLQYAEDALSAARKDIAGMQDRIKALDDQLAGANKTNGDQIASLRKIVDSNSSKIAFNINGGASPATGTFGSVFGAGFDGTCPAGQVMIGIKEEFGGTCNNKCDSDGRPVRNIKVICGSPSVSH